MALVNYLSSEEERVRLIPEQLASFIDIELTETDTIWLFGIDGTLVSQYSDEAEATIRRIEEYKLILEERKINDEFHHAVAIETCHPEFSNQEMQTDEVTKQDSHCNATSWDLFDSMAEEPRDKDTTLKEKNSDGYNDETLIQSLNLMECILSLNLHQSVLTAYRKNKIDKPVPKESRNVTAISHLWSFKSPITYGISVTCLSWNPINLDLLCVGYGGFHRESSNDGLICCWSLKNLLHPKRILRCPSGVTSVDFSVCNSRILACGLYDGTFRVYDILPPHGDLLWDSRNHGYYHDDPIWSLRWLKVPENYRIQMESIVMSEVLVTISSDGFVCQWELRDGHTRKKEIMHLDVKSYQCKPKADVTTKTLFTREPLWGFDINRADLGRYLVSTGWGSVHRCSLLNHKYLRSYEGHDGPVYKVFCSPICDDVFLSCGADWTIKLWHENLTSCLLSLQTSMNQVYDIAWSPFFSTVFAAVSPNRLDFWDLNVSTLEPIVTEKAARKEVMTSLAFSQNSTSLIVGNGSGEVNMYLIEGLRPEEEVERLRVVTDMLVHTMTHRTE